MRKWIAKYQNKAVGVGDNPAQAIQEGAEFIIKTKKEQYIWNNTK